MIKKILHFEEILKNAGALLLKIKKNKRLTYEKQGTQVKSFADQEIDAYLKNNIKKINQFCTIVSEEDQHNLAAHKIPSLDECFVIDPIDGTASFVTGYQGYVSQIAYLKKGTVNFSIVYAPEFDDLYLGIKNEGAYQNGKLIRVKKNEGSIIYIDNYPQPNKPITQMMQKNKNSKYLECGSIGLKICKIAGGEADFFYKNVWVKDWDLLPPSLILKEAGGILLSLPGKPMTPFNNDDYSQPGFVATSCNKLLENLKYIT